MGTIYLTLLITDSWASILGTLWVALLLSTFGLALHRTSRSSRISKGDAVVVDLCLGLVTFAALMFWFNVLLQTVF